MPFFDVKGVSVPAAVSVFPDEIYEAPRSWAEKAYPKLIYYNKMPRGGHFAAWEQPEAVRLRDARSLQIAALMQRGKQRAARAMAPCLTVGGRLR